MLTRGKRRGGWDLLAVDNAAGERFGETISRLAERFSFIGTIRQGFGQTGKVHDEAPILARFQYRGIAVNRLYHYGDLIRRNRGGSARAGRAFRSTCQR